MKYEFNNSPGISRINVVLHKTGYGNVCICGMKEPFEHWLCTTLAWGKSVCAATSNGLHGMAMRVASRKCS